MALLKKELGEPVSLDDLKKHLFTGEPNRYRRAWLNANGESLKGFARAVRDAVDEVNPSLPIALASGAGLWRTDGALATELLDIFSGGNAAYMRLSGGPYWTHPMFWERYKLEMANIFGGGYNTEDLKAIWRKFLTNQFHDILPGTSIHEAMEDCRVAFTEILAEANN